MSNFTPQQIEEFLQEFFDVVGARQYVGARYVPIFGRAGEDTIEWDDLAPYEPLTVVMHDGVSYVSRRYVPAGIEITDTAYWVQTYRFNAQVEQYRQEVLGFADDIADRVPFPDPDFFPKFGTLGQVLSTLEDGTTKWEDPVVPSDEQAEEVITAWLEDHPEATTTVQDRSITAIKLAEGAAFAAPVTYVNNQTCDLGTLTVEGIYAFQYISEAGAYHASFPTNKSGTLIVKYIAGITYQIYFASDTGDVFTRLKAGGTWRAWQNKAAALDTALRAEISTYNTSGGAFTPPVSYTPTQAQDLNELVVPGLYTFTYDSNVSFHASFPINRVGVLIVGKDTTGLVYQIFYAMTGTAPRGYTFVRYKAGSSWVDWTSSSINAPTNYVANQTADLNTFTTDGVYAFQYVSEAGTWNSTFPVPIRGNRSTGTLIVMHAGSIVLQVYQASDNGGMYTRLKANAGWREWRNEAETLANDHEVSILFVGNSLTADAISYVPWLLKTYFPSVRFRLYGWYIGGYTLAQQLAAWQNNATADEVYIAENSASWTIYPSNTTMADVLSNHTFDVVCMQEYFNYKNEYTDADIATWNACRDYLTANYAGTNGFEFVSLFHAPKRDRAEAIFTLTEQGNAKILQDTIAQDMIPVGIAIYRALDTALNSLGDDGGLSNDGTHAQEGLPCLLQAMTATLWILDHIGYIKSVYGSNAKMTAAIYNSLTIPSPNLGTGVIPGTNAENLLAQQVAIEAFKEGKKFVADNIA